VKVGVGARKAGDPFTVLIASGMKPGPSRVELNPARRNQDPERKRRQRAGVGPRER